MNEPVRQDAIVQMQDELRRALSRPQRQRRWVMVIDRRKCVGCHACTVGCVAENKLPPGVVYRPVLEEETGTYPKVGRTFLARPCMQCDRPPCTKVCPAGATEKNADGVVVIDYEECIGCRKCVAACPYGARTFDSGDFATRGTPDGLAIVGQGRAGRMERSPSFEYARAWPRAAGAPPVDKVRKCHFCMHRLAEGVLPACVTTCVGRATYFGDANDAASTVARLVKLPNATRLEERLGTAPRVFYLV
ncbi:MAG TPA: 4Fe-4S dicluster domain-containing protein [Anaeromyxobacter sp.]